MTSFFSELFKYSHHYNQLLIARLLENPDQVSEKAIQLFNHIINAHQIWNGRVLNEAPFGIFEIHPARELQQLDSINFQNTLKIMESRELSEIVDYRNTKGQAYSNSLRDILFHVINHSTYHRAQIATEFKQHGMDSVTTDYIHYKWMENKL